ncbi:MAG: amidohydrolase family protein [Planctomycetes bacterium]|nr:amidohydrolase family protein [Planctomycetota bacterium]
MKIVDMHAHVDVMEAFNWVDTPDKLIRLMDEAGIAYSIAAAYSNWPARDPDALERLCTSLVPYRDRLFPFIRMDPGYGNKAIELLDEGCKNFGIKGVKLHPTDYTLHPFGAFTVNLVRRAGELGIPVLLHCGDEVMSYPLQIGEMARQCPDTVIIMAHMGGVFHTRDALTVAGRYSNVYVDTSEIPHVAPVRMFVDAIGPERVLFGTDSPYCDPLVELEKVKLAGLTDEEYACVCSRNGLRLLGIDGGAA